MFKFRLKKLLKVIFVAAVVSLCVLLAWSLIFFILNLDRQWWEKLIIFFGLAMSLLIAFLLRKLVLKRREMKFVDGIIGSDETPGSISDASDADRELRRRFKEAVTTLKRSDLKKSGNPLYVLPWYLLVGKSGAGKSTAIKSARLPSPFGDVNRISGIEGTRNCDWWFFDKSVVIDIAGRYSIHRNEELDKKEWQAFLHHLVRYRKKEPINGIIVTAEADKLSQSDAEKLGEEGRTIRKRLDEVISVMGAKFPIYLLVTKCDLIFGMNRYCQLLSRTSTEQAMGLMNHDGQTDIHAFADQTMDTLVDKLKDIRLILANNEDVCDHHYIEPEVLAFPEEFNRMRGGLIAFCKGAFKDNPFQELPFVRGIYFCSGQQVGRPLNSQYDDLKRLDNDELPGTGKGFFLFDFFSKILPSDRSMYALTTHAKEWRRLTQNLWLTGFATIILVLCIFLTYSWNQNKAAMNLVSPQYKKTILFENDTITDIGIMEQFSREIKALEMRNKDWKFPRFGLNAALKLEKQLKQRYCDRFNEHFEADIYTDIQNHLASGGWEQDNSAPAVAYIPFLVRRLNIMNSRFELASGEDMMALPDPGCGIILKNEASAQDVNELSARYKQAYINYLLWQGNIEVLNTSLVTIKRLLENYFHENKGDLRWLAQWADNLMAGKAVTMNRFWHSRVSDSGLPNVKPAFSKQGHQLIGEFVTKELDRAVDQPLWITGAKTEFSTWYKTAYFEAWMAYGLNFHRGLNLFGAPKERYNILKQLCNDTSPYLALMETLETELFADDDEIWPSLALNKEKDQDIAQWLTMIRKFSLIRKSAIGDGANNNKVMDRIAQKVSVNSRIVAEIAMGQMAESDIIKAKEAYQAYKSALSDFSSVTASSQSAYEVAKQGFEDSATQAKSPVMAAQSSLEAMGNLIDNDGIGSTFSSKGREAFLCLFSRPVDQLWRFTVSKAAGHLQQLWDEQVIAETQGINDRHQVGMMLFGENGFVDRYNREFAGPFLSKSSKRGYYARTMREAGIPFTPDFFNFLSQGKQWISRTETRAKSNYVVDIEAMPTDVNPDARLKPHMTQLTIESSEGELVLVNRQYPIARKFNWVPATCGDVTLRIMIGDTILTEKYTGYCAFGKFLADFKNGRKQYTVSDFPEFASELNRMGIRQIDVVYSFQSAQTDPIIQLLRSQPGRPPARIIASSL